MELDARRDQIRSSILDAIPRAGGPRPIRPRWMRWLPEGCHFEGTYAFEHTECDDDHLFGTGIRAAWLINHEGIATVEMTPAALGRQTQGRRGRWYRYVRRHFWIAPEADRFVQFLAHGPLAGSGSLNRVLFDGDSMTFRGERHWRS